jgi:acyl-CoA reductase-like NAD-dependent aldehyde dehydrogenase
VPDFSDAFQNLIGFAATGKATAPVGGPETATGDRYVQPTVLVGVTPDALAATEETFGPTLAVVKVADTEEAIALVNSSPYGLGSSVFSRHRGEAIRRRRPPRIRLPARHHRKDRPRPVPHDHL